MKAVLYIEAPTQYQLQSLNRFGLPVTKSSFGHYYSKIWFDTVIEARTFLKNQADSEYENEPEKLKQNLTKDSLTIDAVTGYIFTEKKLNFFKRKTNGIKNN